MFKFTVLELTKTRKFYAFRVKISNMKIGSKFPKYLMNRDNISGNYISQQSIFRFYSMNRQKNFYFLLKSSSFLCSYDFIFVQVEYSQSLVILARSTGSFRIYLRCKPSSDRFLFVNVENFLVIVHSNTIRTFENQFSKVSICKILSSMLT